MTDKKGRGINGESVVIGAWCVIEVQDIVVYMLVVLVVLGVLVGRDSVPMVGVAKSGGCSVWLLLLGVDCDNCFQCRQGRGEIECGANGKTTAVLAFLFVQTRSKDRDFALHRPRSTCSIAAVNLARASSIVRLPSLRWSGRVS